MPQARLPDVNTAIIVYRREAISDLKSERYDSCLGALNALNGMLPDEYRVVIDTEKYDIEMREGLYAVCKHCEKDSEAKTLKTFELMLPFVNSIVSGSDTEEVWICSNIKCQKQNKSNETKYKNKSFKKPYYLKIVPDPPERKAGMLSRTIFHNKFSSWFWTTLGEIEAQFAQFRDDNWKKQGSIYDEDDIGDDTGEDKWPIT